MTAADAQFRSPRFVHVLAELGGCDPKLLDDRGVVEAALRDASAAADATVLEIRSCYHPIYDRRSVSKVARSPRSPSTARLTVRVRFRRQDLSLSRNHPQWT